MQTVLLHFCFQKAGQESRRSQTFIPPRATGIKLLWPRKGPICNSPILRLRFQLTNCPEDVLRWQGSPQTTSSLGGCSCLSSKDFWVAIGFTTNRNFLPLTFPSTRLKECLTFPKLGKICLFTVCLSETKRHFLFYLPLHPHCLGNGRWEINKCSWSENCSSCVWIGEGLSTVEDPIFCGRKSRKTLTTNGVISYWQSFFLRLQIKRKHWWVNQQCSIPYTLPPFVKCHLMC